MSVSSAPVKQVAAKCSGIERKEALGTWRCAGSRAWYDMTSIRLNVRVKRPGSSNVPTPDVAAVGQHFDLEAGTHKPADALRETSMATENGTECWSFKTWMRRKRSIQSTWLAQPFDRVNRSCLGNLSS